MIPTTEQQAALDAFATGESLAIVAGAGTGKTSTLVLLAGSSPRRGRYLAFNKALRFDQPVATERGWRPIGELVTGDRVFGLDGALHHVTAVTDRGVRPMYRVAFSDGSVVIADGDHLWLVDRTHTANTRYVHTEIASTADIAEHLRRRRSVRLPLRAPLKLPHVDLPVDPWLLGAILGDGSVGHGRVWLTNLDDWTFSEAERRLPAGCSLRWIHTPDRRAKTASIVGDRTRNPLLDHLRAMGVYGRTAADKFVPEPYLWSSAEQRLSLLRGLMDTDGSAGALSVTPIFTTTSTALADAVVFLTRSLGGAAAIRTMRDATDVWARAFQVTVRLPAGVVPFSLPSRAVRLRARTHDRLLHQRVISVEPCEPAQAVCISVDAPDRLFLTAGLVPTHNSIVTDSGRKFPPNVACSTVHSLAYRAVGNRYERRIRNRQRMKSLEIARIIGVDRFAVTYGTQSKVLAPGYLAGLAVRSVKNFCQSGDPELAAHHVPFVDGIDDPTKMEKPNNAALADYLLAAMRKVWADATNVDGVLPYDHGFYLKEWELSGPRTAVDFLMVDEAQDLSGVMLSIIRQQPHAQIVLVGDPHQSIYAWLGAVDAFAHLETTHRTQLSQSFRFGPAIAEVANDVLGLLGADLQLRGIDSIESKLVTGGRPDAILTRTNATAVKAVMAAMRAGRRPHLVGGGDDVLSFARGAADLIAGSRSFHPDLACFDTWPEVVEYSRADEIGVELKLLVDLVEEFGPADIISTLERCSDESLADIVISTAHKAKGREWGHVKLGDDFPDLDPFPSDEELRLLYVAVTRARVKLDISNVPDLVELPLAPPDGRFATF